MSEPAMITLTTDFGRLDSYVAQMKGVMLCHDRRLRWVDISHDIAPQAIASAAYVLATACGAFPAGTVHLVVVDPGVGSSRRPLVAEAGGQLFVGPDNGVLTRVLQAGPGARVHAIENPAFHPAGPSATFHGRDVFAPTAARLATGARPADAGPAVSDPVLLPPGSRPRADGSLETDVVHIDTFGNLILDPRRDAIESWVVAGQGGPGGRGAGGLDELVVRLHDRRIDRLRRTYAEVHDEHPFLLFNSAGHLEIACTAGSAASRLGAGLGDVAILTHGRGRVL